MIFHPFGRTYYVLHAYATPCMFPNVFRATASVTRASVVDTVPRAHSPSPSPHRRTPRRAARHSTRFPSIARARHARTRTQRAQAGVDVRLISVGYCPSLDLDLIRFARCARDGGRERRRAGAQGTCYGAFYADARTGGDVDVDGDGQEG